MCEIKSLNILKCNFNLQLHRTRMHLASIIASLSFLLHTLKFFLFLNWLHQARISAIGAIFDPSCNRGLENRYNYFRPQIHYSLKNRYNYFRHQIDYSLESRYKSTFSQARLYPLIFSSTISCSQILTVYLLHVTWIWANCLFLTFLIVK
jgi:hypothetical protein